MNVFKQVQTNRAFPSLLAMAAALSLSSCGVSEGPSRTRESVQLPSVITASVGTEVNGITSVEAATSKEYPSRD